MNAARQPHGPGSGEASPYSLSSSAHGETLTAQEHIARELFGILCEPVVGASPDGLIVLVNAAAAEILGPGERFYGCPIERALPFLAPPPGVDVGSPVVWRGSFESARGRTVELEVSATAFGEKYQGFTVYSIRDVTDDAERSRSQEQLLYAVAHELGSPLTLISSTIDLLLEETDILSTDEARRLLETARRTSHRAKILLDGLLSAGNIKAGTFEVRPEPTRLREVVDGAVDMALPLARARAQLIHCDVPHELEAHCDREYTHQVVFNLLSNASKYSPHGELILVRAEQRGRQALVTITDRGPGMHPHESARVFERFYRTPRGRQRKGVGLGLAIAKGIVEAHGGEIGLESAPGKGTSVWFTLPSI